jgi:hypothetical protein
MIIIMMDGTGGSFLKKSTLTCVFPIESMMIILKVIPTDSCPSIPTQLHSSPLTEYTTQKLVYSTPPSVLFNTRLCCTNMIKSSNHSYPNPSRLRRVPDRFYYSVLTTGTTFFISSHPPLPKTRKRKKAQGIKLVS